MIKNPICFLQLFLWFSLSAQILHKTHSKYVNNNLIRQLSETASGIEESPPPCSSSLCLTPNCIHTSSRILETVAQKDHGVSSDTHCNNFYRFSCEGWQESNSHKIADDTLYYASNMNQMPDKINIILKKLIEKKLSLSPKFYSSKPYHDVSALYYSCLDVDGIRAKAIQPALHFLESLESIQTQFPFDSSKFQLSSAILELALHNGSPLFHIGLEVSFFDPKRWAISVSVPAHSGLLPELFAKGHKKANTYLYSATSQSLLKKLFSVGEDHLPILELVTDLLRERDKLDTNKINSDVTHHAQDVLDIKPKENITVVSLVPNENYFISATKLTSLSESTTKFPASNASVETTSFAITTEASLHSSQTHSSPPTKPEMETQSTPVAPNSNDLIDNIEDVFQNYNKSMDDILQSLVELLGEPPLVSRKVVYSQIKEEMEADRSDLISTFINSLWNKSLELDDVVLSAEDVTQQILYFVQQVKKLEPREHEQILLRQQGQTFNFYNISQMQKEFNFVNWSYIFTNLINDTFPDGEMIPVPFPKYLKDLSDFISTQPSWVVNYGLAAIYYFDVLRELVEVEPNISREEFCLDVVTNTFTDAMSYMYLQYVGHNRIQEIQQSIIPIISLLSSSLEHFLRTSSWIPPSQIDEAVKKIQTLDLQIGAFEEAFSMNYVLKFHDGLSISKDDFFHNAIDLYKNYRGGYTLYNNPLDKNTLIWSFTTQPYTTNAFYLPSTNSIVLPEAFFHPPYFTLGAPVEVVMGGAGIAIAHEMIHAVDFTGLAFTNMGVYENKVSQTVISGMKEKVKCFNHFLQENFVEIESLEFIKVSMDLNTDIAMNEIYADMAGLEVAWHAFQRIRLTDRQENKQKAYNPKFDKSGTPKRESISLESNVIERGNLPGISWNDEELFFITFAQPYCAIMPSIAKIVLMELDEHLPHQIRINSLVQNFAPFSQNFNCMSNFHPSTNISTPKCFVFT